MSGDWLSFAEAGILIDGRFGWQMSGRSQAMSRFLDVRPNAVKLLELAYLGHIRATADAWKVKILPNDTPVKKDSKYLKDLKLKLIECLIADELGTQINKYSKINISKVLIEWNLASIDDIKGNYTLIYSLT